jgi:hypothetical protein
MKKEEKELLNRVEKAAYKYEQKYTGCAQCVWEVLKKY